MGKGTVTELQNLVVEGPVVPSSNNVFDMATETKTHIERADTLWRKVMEQTTIDSTTADVAQSVLTIDRLIIEAKAELGVLMLTLVNSENVKGESNKGKTNDD